MQRANLSKLLALTDAGEEVIIARGDKPVVRLIAIPAAQPGKRKFGALKGQLKLTDAFSNRCRKTNSPPGRVSIPPIRFRSRPGNPQGASGSPKSSPLNRRFQLADYVEVSGASLKDGLLYLTLVRNLPERMKPRTVPISTAAAKQIEAAA